MKDFHKKVGPFIKSSNSTKKIMRNLLIALLPIIAFTFYKNGIVVYSHDKCSFIEMFYPLLFILIPTVSSFIFENLYAFIFLHKRKDEFKEYIGESFSIFPGLFLGLILPINTPISIVIFGSLMATIVAKMLFGGFGNNIFNPALVGRLFVIATYALVISSSGGYLNAYEVDTISSATPLTNASLVSGIGTYETLVQPYGNMWNFFIGTMPGAMGETSALLCIIAFIYLTITGVIKWKIPVVYVGTVFLLTSMIGNINDLGIWYPLFQICSGGLMFGAVFMATDPVTSPTTPIAQILYGLFLGISTVIFRYLTPFPEGVLTSILTMNMFVFILDKIGSRSRFNFKKSLIPFIIAWVLIIGLGFYIGSSYKNVSLKDPDYAVVSKETIGDETTYVATQKGYSGIIKAKIVIKNGDVTRYEVIEQSDSFYSKVSDSDYLKKLIKEQKNLDDVDTVSGATISSTAVKKLLINTIEDYKNGGSDVASREEEKGDPNFKIISKDTDNDATTYVVSQKGFSSDIKLQLVIKYNSIQSMTVLEQDDSYFNLVVDANYITTLIESQKNVEEVDTVSGATFSSKALKNAIINTMNDYEG